MPSLQIRNLPDDLYQALSFRAEQAHRSLAQQALVELRRASELAASGRRKQVLQAIKSRLEAEGPQVLAAPEELLRADRDR